MNTNDKTSSCEQKEFCKTDNSDTTILVYQHFLQTNLVQVIHEHLAHLVYWNSCINWTAQTKFPNQIRQSSDMKRIRERQKHCINLMYVSATRTHSQQ